MFVIHRLLLAAVSLLTPAVDQSAAQNVPSPSSLAIVVPNDNRRPAGLLANETLVLNLRAAAGLWRPEGDTGPALKIEAFGEDGDLLRAPAPLIRVPEGTQIVASIRNELDAPLRVFGLCTREGKTCAPIDVPPAATREVCFTATRVGTFHYWATTTGMPLEFRAAGDTQLSGAFVVDPLGAPADADRIIVITDWTSLTKQQLRDLAQLEDPGSAFLAMKPQFTALMNGLSWPATERLIYR